MFNLFLLFFKMSLNLTFTELCKELIDYNVLEFGNFKLSNGSHSEYYFDIKKIYSNKKLFNKIVDIMVSKIKSCYFDNYKYICGVPFGSLPLTTALSIKLNKPILFIRKEKKQYGNKSQIEGEYSIGDTVLLIEDIISTGHSIENSKNILINNGLIPVGFSVFLNREIGGFDLLNNCEFKGMYVYKLSSIMTNLVNNNLIESFDNNKYENSTMIQQSNFKNKINKIKENKEYLKKRDFSYNKIQNIIFKLIEDKKTNLCLDLTHITSWKQCKDIINICGPYIILLRIDIEALIDFDNIKMFCFEIRNIMKKHRFLTINNCNFDVKDINKLFNSYLLYNEWSNFITVTTKDEKKLFKIVNEHGGDLSICCLDDYKPNKLNYEKLEFYDLKEYDNNSPIVFSSNKITKNRLNVYNLDWTDFVSSKMIITKDKYHLVTISKYITSLYNETNNTSLLKFLDLLSHKTHSYYLDTFKIVPDIDLEKEFDELFKLNDIEIEAIDKEELYSKVRKELEDEQEKLSIKHNILTKNEIELYAKINSFNMNKYYIYGAFIVLLQSYYIIHHTSFFN